MLKKLCKIDDNLLSFLCGIFSSIPISICFSFTALGNTYWDHIYFSLLLLSMVTSIALVIFAIQFTLRKKKYLQPILDQKDGELEKSDALDDFLENGIIAVEKHDKLLSVKSSKYLRKPIVRFLVCAVILIVDVVSLWVACNFT